MIKRDDREHGLAALEGQPMTRPRFRDPRDRWPELGDLIPEPLPGPFGDALAALAQCVPSLSEERRIVIAQAMLGQPKTIAWLARTLQEHAPDLFDPSEDSR